MSIQLQRITRKTLLYKSGRRPGSYALNHVEGCAHGCTFPCHGYLIKKRTGRIASYEDWCKPRIVENALELLDKELVKLDGKIERVSMCLATDPFMYGVDEVQRLTLAILRRLRDAGVGATILTKGAYLEELADTDTYGVDNEYGITLVSLSDDFHERFEPGSAPVSERIAALKRLHDVGLSTWVNMEPYPTPNIIKQDIREILEAVSFADEIIFGRWNYNRLVSSFPHAREFYDSMAHQVAKFGEQRGIAVRVHTFS